MQTIFNHKFFVDAGPTHDADEYACSTIAAMHWGIVGTQLSLNSTEHTSIEFGFIVAFDVRLGLLLHRTTTNTTFDRNRIYILNSMLASIHNFMEWPALHIAENVSHSITYKSPN